MSSPDFTSLDKVKEFAKITNTDDDDLLERLVTAASGFMSDYVDRDLLAAEHSYSGRGTGATRLSLPEYPVTEILFVKANGRTIPASVNYLSGYRFDEFGVDLVGYCFPKGSIVEVSYVAGLTELPSEVEQCCVELALLLYRNQQRIGKSSEGIQGQTIGYLTTELPLTIKMVLDSYKKKVPS